MSIYNMINKVNPSTFFILPLLEIGHPDDWPRFRDCFSTAREFRMVGDNLIMAVVDEKEQPAHIYVLLRIGGENRKAYTKQIAGLRSHPNYVKDWDDSYNDTYAHWMFSVPEKWREDYKKAILTDYNKTSEEYQKLLRTMFPKLERVFDSIFKVIPN